MNTVLMISIALLLTALFGSIVLWVRSRETLVGLCAALFGAIAIHQAVALWNHWDAPFAFNAWALGGLAGVVASVISVFAVVSLRRILEDRGDIETLLWDNTESVGIFDDLPLKPNLPQSKPDLSKVDRSIHANRILRRIEGELRSLAGERIELELKLGSELGLARAPRIALDVIVQTLVVNAREAMPGGGRLVIETANLDLASDKSGVIPAVAPARYVTLSLRDSGSAPDAEQLAQLYQSISQDAEPVSDAADRLSLPEIYRILQAGGGDLSVDVEPERGCTFTIYLPRVSTRSRTPSQGARLPAPPSATV
jgi:signal transduction histidine kinase